MTPSDASSSASYYVLESQGPSEAATELVWLHGWGHDRHAFDGIVAGFQRGYRHHRVDLPGFGQAAAPPSDWGTAEYADGLAGILGPPRGPRFLIGHSFGCRVALQWAARHPPHVQGLVLIAAAGLPRRRSPLWHLRAWGLRRLGHLAAWIDARTGTNRWRERFVARVGSADYRQAGPLRPVLVRVVNEDLSAVATRVHVPTLLLYGARDQATPVALGRRFEQLMPRAQLICLPGFDHYSVLGAGRHQVQRRIAEFLSQNRSATP
jgi:pimeloyl-ACP methyl ester carboxylesterase